MTTRRATADNTKVTNAFLAAKVEIDAMLERLKALSEDHFDTHPDEVHWSQVGSFNHYASPLRKISDSAFSEGERVKWPEQSSIRPRDGGAYLHRRGRIPRARPKRHQCPIRPCFTNWHQT